LEKAFRRFAQRVPADGLLVARKECPATQRVVQGLKCRVLSFGWSRSAHWSARNLRHRSGRYRFSIYVRSKQFWEVSLRVPGKHNVLNALAAAALACEGSFVSGDQIALGLGQFAGLRRRLETVGTWRGATLIDDYAHHPTEVAAGLRTIRQMYPGRRLWRVFQPHQASRTAHLLDELAASLQNADKVIVAGVYRAREPHPKAGEAAAGDLAEKVRSGGTEVSAVGRSGAIVELLESRLRHGGVLVTMGAGGIRKVCDGLLERAGDDRAAR
jgi:UDP-N-acetylmuramate--alanine ligase